MDERMKRKYTEMVFHFFQEYFPGTRIYEGKFIKKCSDRQESTNPSKRVGPRFQKLF